MTKLGKDQELLKQAQEDVNFYLDTTEEARSLSERDRDYIDGKQWTRAEEQKLRQRGQNPIVINRMKPKHQGLLGLLDLRRSDPKAYPRTKKHENSSEAITDGLRYVLDNNDFQTTVRLDVADNFFCEGVAGALVDVFERFKGDTTETEIRIQHIPWDRIYYDPHSRSHNFKDARFLGFMLWMDVDQFTAAYPRVDVTKVLGLHGDDETFEDRPRWVDTDKRRIRVANHFFVNGDTWFFTQFTENMFLFDPIESPYLDEDGVPTCPLEYVSANIDRDNNRYGEARHYIGAQDEINHRRSRALHVLNNRQTFGTKGSSKDAASIKREMSKPDGHIEFRSGEQFGRDFGVIPTNDIAQGQFQLYQDAKGELDSVGFNAQLAGERQSGDLSGKAIDRLQQAGTIELNRQYTLLNAWEKRIYRQVWARMKQFWDGEKWIRVTDDQGSLRWVGLNVPVTVQQLLEETINDESKPQNMRIGAAATYQAMIAAQDPRLKEVVEVSNSVPEIDVDIILDQSFDTVNIQQEQFQILAQFAQSSQDIDVIELIELSQIRGKEELIEKIEKRRAQVVEATGNIQQLKAQEIQVKNVKTLSDAGKSEQEALQKSIENQLLLANPPEQVTQVSV